MLVGERNSPAAMFAKALRAETEQRTKGDGGVLAEADLSLATDSVGLGIDRAVDQFRSAA